MRLLAWIPAVCLTFSIPFVNRLEPRVLGLPFLVAWIAFWVLMTPAFLWAVYRADRGS
ncbi:MAG: hypothetical protein DLM53_08095 [Candidatus Eremiobacter antarcticus]|nr:MAG: hypothetical protein DLM53_08095 [Candidatus Eremiobacter sp. RRmetagenome_bin22]